MRIASVARALVAASLAVGAITAGFGAAQPSQAASVAGTAPVTMTEAMPAQAATTGRARAANRRSSKVVYLTFDDGPSAQYTPQVLRVLKKHHAKATFFMIGTNARSNPALVRRVRAEGHAVGNHTWSHPWLTRLSSSQVRSQIQRTDKVIGRTRCVRPPGGFVSPGVRRTIAGTGKKVAMWTVDPRDWARPGQASIQRTILANTRSGSIVLMHDGGGPRAQSVAALDVVLSRLKARGYRFETLPACR